MSHFEYVSVAIALLSALVMGRLLSGFSPALDRNRRYWVHLGWVMVLILVCVGQWWGLWRMRQVSWTPIRFLFVLSMPGLLFVQAAVLMGDDPGRVDSFREHFFNRRVRFFSVALVSAIVLAFSGWVFGLVPWLDASRMHLPAAAVVVLSVAGIGLKSHTSHAVLVVFGLLLAAAGFVITRPDVISV